MAVTPTPDSEELLGMAYDESIRTSRIGEAERFDAWWREQDTGLSAAHRMTAWNAWLARSLPSETRTAPQVTQEMSGATPAPTPAAAVSSDKHDEPVAWMVKCGEETAGFADQQWQIEYYTKQRANCTVTPLYTRSHVGDSRWRCSAVTVPCDGDDVIGYWEPASNFGKRDVMLVHYFQQKWCPPGEPHLPCGTPDFWMPLSQPDSTVRKP
jgi:hypothetical protein